MSDELWQSLLIPINLAFFYRQSATGKVLAMYPSPAGAIESNSELRYLERDRIAESGAAEDGARGGNPPE